jgi:hypothetical protein
VRSGYLMITVRSFGCAQDDAGGVALRMTRGVGRRMTWGVALGVAGCGVRSGYLMITVRSFGCAQDDAGVALRMTGVLRSG